MPPYVNVHYNAPTHNVRPALDTMRKRGLKDRKRGGMESLEGDFSEKWQARQAVERREQYRQVRFEIIKILSYLSVSKYTNQSILPATCSNLLKELWKNSPDNFFYNLS